MLKALYDYGVRNGLTLPPGFVKKQIRAYISLTANGDFLGMEQCTDELLPCPDIGSLANSPDKCNLLAEKCGIILFVPQPEAQRAAPKMRSFARRCAAVPKLCRKWLSVLPFCRMPPRCRQLPTKLPG